jgi:hypothetical protein
LQPDIRIDALKGHHQLILTDIGDAKRELARNDASSAKALALIRWELMRHLRAYQLYKHTRIFDPLIASSSPSRSGAAADLKSRCIELSSAYEAHVKRWSLTGPAGAWDRYVTEAMAMSARIERHLALEDEEVGKLLDVTNRHGRT